MILKVKRFGKEIQCWTYLDNIRKVTVTKAKLVRSEIPPNENVNLRIFDIDKQCSCISQEERCSDCVQYLTLICRLDNDEEYILEFDTFVYLMNDSGKTIEKIVANLC